MIRSADTDMGSVDKLFRYMRPAKLACLPKRPEEKIGNWVLWSQEEEKEEDDDSEYHHYRQGVIQRPSIVIRERIKNMLHQLPPLSLGRNRALIQFWAPEIRRGGRCFLTTQDQPFALSNLSKSMCCYRKQCMNIKIYIPTGQLGDKQAGEDEEELGKLGPVGRAFRYGLPESSPYLSLYSIQDFPLRLQACSTGLPRLIALPVYEIHARTETCVGVLECLCISLFGLSSITHFVDLFEQELKAVGLTTNYIHFKPRPEHFHITPRKQELVHEVKMALEAAGSKVALALAFYPCYRTLGSIDEYCGGSDFSSGFDDDQVILKLALSESPPLSSEAFQDFIEAHKKFCLQKGKGVAGKAFAASGKLCFCRDIRGFNITDYPFVHYARRAGLGLSFAICLQSTRVENFRLVVEFFLSPTYCDYDDVSIIFYMKYVVSELNRCLQSFKVVFQDLPEEEVFASETTRNTIVQHLGVIASGGWYRTQTDNVNKASQGRSEPESSSVATICNNTSENH